MTGTSVGWFFLAIALPTGTWLITRRTKGSSTWLWLAAFTVVWGAAAYLTWLAGVQV
jgi:hypothetical protein